ncbi:MAG: hypothetical protein M3Q73_02040 [bacterium]|nr:hypothetical protein [bacterium]
MNKQQWLAMVMAVLVVLGGAIWGVVLTTGSPSLAKSDVPGQEVFVPGPKVSARLQDLSQQMEKTAQYELAYGCTEDHPITKEKILCGESVVKMKKIEDEYNKEYIKINKRSDQEIAKVKAHARQVTENPSLELEFTGTFNSPYTEKKPKRVEYYRDSNGSEYTVDPTTNKVVEFTDTTAVEQPVKNLNVAALKEKVEKYLYKNISDFDQVKKTFIYEEGGKGDPAGDAMYAFRWNAPSRINGEDVPPYIMVRVTPSGKLIGFSDTRSLYK